MRRKRRAPKRVRVVASRPVMVRGVRTQPPARDASGRWVSVPEDILWGVYIASPQRWPHLRGMSRQVPVLGYRLDFGRSDLRRGVEVDGLAFHGGQVEWARDHQRQRRIEAAGWRVSRFTAREAAENPVGVLDELNRLWGGWS